MFAQCVYKRIRDQNKRPRSLDSAICDVLFQKANLVIISKEILLKLSFNQYFPNIWRWLTMEHKCTATKIARTNVFQGFYDWLSMHTIDFYELLSWYINTRVRHGLHFLKIPSTNWTWYHFCYQKKHILYIRKLPDWQPEKKRDYKAPRTWNYILQSKNVELYSPKS